METSKLDPKTVQPDPSHLFRWLLLWASLLSIGFLLFAALKENYLSEWQRTQRQYRSLLSQRASDALGRGILRDFRVELKQISVPPLNSVDRCVSCHTGIDDPRMADLPQPFKTHPGDILTKHPADRFGCTICHQGQGLATTFQDAAHDELDFWERPMLKGDFLQASCVKCHVEPDFAGTPLVAAGRSLFSGELSCNTCHMIRGEGGRDCADLTFVGSKSLRTFDFSHLPGERTRSRWLFEHFKNPQAVVPASEMPNMEMTDEQARALTVFMLSLTENRIPVEYLAPKPAQTAVAPATATEDHAQLEQQGCLACHSVAGHGGKSGPDLVGLSPRHTADWLFRHVQDSLRTSAGAVNSSRPPDRSSGSSTTAQGHASP